MRRAVRNVLLVVIAVATIITWFTKTPILCNQLIDQRLINGVDIDEDMREKWIRDNYPLARFNLTLQNKKHFTWKSFNKKYRIVNNGGNQTLYQYWQFQNVSIRDVLRCLGKPDSYSGAWHFPADAFQSHFSIWYQKEGYIFTSGLIYSDEEVTIDMNVPIFF